MARSAAPSRKPSPAGKRSLNPLYVVLGVVALAAIGFFVYRGTGGGGKAATQPVQVVLSQAELNRVQGISLGSENAPVVIWEFADYQCPGCANFATFISPLIKERLVNSGQARFVFYDFPLVGNHPHAFLAARAGRCANEQGRFWEYHDVIFAKQPTWSRERDPAGLFVDYAQQVGLDRGKFEACLYSDRYAREVTESMQFGQAQGVEGTPSLFVNGKRLPQIPDFQELQAIVQREAGGGAAGAPAVGGDTAGHAH
ncbi:MAG: DsbA family protein [Gemmatimonadota bacterium]|nr:DsbA family protein [Gemmatimonadota bacterium]